MFDIQPHFSTLMLAQGNGAAPPIPGEAQPSTSTSDPGLPAPDGTAPSAGPGGGPQLIIIMFLVITAMIVMSIFGQRRERKKREALIRAVKKHDKVQTVGGVIGSVVELKPDFVVLKVDESSNTRITFARSAIQQVIKSSDSRPEEAEKVENV